jgi:type IV pilus assembly protein PilW
MGRTGGIDMKFNSKKSKRGCTSGFTLVELMMAMVVSMLIMGAIYIAFSSQQRTQIAQDNVAEMQQNIRAALVILSMDLRMAGYNPPGTVVAGAPVAGFVNGVNFTHPGGTVPVSTSANQIAFTVDLDQDGVIDLLAQDVNGDTSIDMTEMEQVAYKLNGTNLQRFSTTNGAITTAWQTIAEQIERIEFRYLDASGSVTTDLTKIRAVVVSILAITGRGDSQYTNNQTYTTVAGTLWPVNDNFRRRFLETTIHCRNMRL